jgi:hypothetical protein
MFVPLLLGLAVVILVTQDLRNPRVNAHYDCRVVATGHTAHLLRNEKNVLYENGGGPQQDIAFRCPSLGLVVANEYEIGRQGEIPAGAKAQLHHKAYRFMPSAWHMNLEVPRPETSDSLALPIR